jgi:peptide/nickel transport system substrate-binding protein
MDENQRRLDRIRRGSSELENSFIDEFAAGRISRREFVRRGAVVGLSMPLMTAIIAACGGANNSGGSSSPSSGGGGGAKPGGTIKAGIVTPTAEINPVTVADQGGLDMLGQCGEYLALSNSSLQLVPVLAEKWTPNSDSTVWTFDIRQGVKFHNGQPLTADDVVYTYKLQTNPNGKSNALSAFGGALTPSGVQKVDDFTVAFHLEAPNGNFPYLCSSDNYNMIIIPNNYDPSKWESSFLGTGPFKMKSYTPKVGASFIRNEDYWGTKALPDSTEFTFYDTQEPEILALQGGTIDVVGQFAVQGGQSLLSSSSVKVINLKSSAHRELSMRCDQAPFNDPRVRQAMALTLNRPDIVQGLFQGKADIGNDSPFAPVFPSTDTSVAQRAQDLTKAKQLLQAAGHGSGFSTKLFTENFLEIPQLAQIMKASAAKVGVSIALTIETSSQYYGKAVFGQSDWLDGAMSLVDYGHRSVPNVFLTAPLQSKGTWNAAHFKNKEYDTLSQQYIAAPATDVQSQKTIAGKIENLLLEQTPIIYPYFYNYLTATASGVSGVEPTAIGHLFLFNATKS